jgi:hypothetical protein
MLRASIPLGGICIRIIKRSSEVVIMTSWTLCSSAYSVIQATSFLIMIGRSDQFIALTTIGAKREETPRSAIEQTVFHFSKRGQQSEFRPKIEHSTRPASSDNLRNRPAATGFISEDKKRLGRPHLVLYSSDLRRGIATWPRSARFRRGTLHPAEPRPRRWLLRTLL